MYVLYMGPSPLAVSKKVPSVYPKVVWVDKMAGLSDISTMDYLTYDSVSKLYSMRWQSVKNKEGG